MAGSNQWVMGSDTSDKEAWIENEDGNAIVQISRLMNPGSSFVRPATDEQWQSIVDCIAAAPEMLTVLKRVVADAWGDSDRVEAMVNAVEAVLAKAEPPRKVKRRMLVTVEVEVEGDADAPTDVFKSHALDFVYTGGGAGMTFKGKTVTTLGELYEE